jgi:hypothetical protein
VQSDTELLEIINALSAAGRFACCLNCRQQQSDEDADDRNHNQQLDKRKTV